MSKSIMIVVDIWGGEKSQEYLARYVRPLEEALKISKSELLSGYLVNLLMFDSDRKIDEFDNRVLNTGNYIQ